MGTVLGWNPPDVHLPRLDTYLMSLCSVTVYRLCTTPLIAKKKISSGHLYYSKRQLLLTVLVEHTFCYCQTFCLQELCHLCIFTVEGICCEGCWIFTICLVFSYFLRSLKKQDHHYQNYSWKKNHAIIKINHLEVVLLLF